MWKSVPALVELREDVARFISNTVEKGGPEDYVTFGHLIQLYREARPNLKHHRDQLQYAFKDNMPGTYVYAVLVPAGITAGAEEEKEYCMGCGETSKAGYRNAFQGIRLRGSKTHCPFNYGCDCVDGGGIMLNNRNVMM